ncbi:MAG TPA: GMC family oxidoreductase [Candidatus Binatia bacterium]|nr:GMC family oxidoreductase [Candidatus Binatia bacterium]
MTRHDAVDVVVVGAGMAGAAFCKRLSERAPQLRIVCLERGDWVRPDDMPATRRDWQRAGFGAWALSPNERLASGAANLSADYPIDDTGSAIKPLMWNGVGGSTINWGAHFPRLHPSDFRTRTLDGVGDDWPFSYFDLEPYYDANDVEMGVSGLAGDPAYPPKPARRMPPLPLGRLGTTVARGFDALGWHWWPVDAAINSAPYDGRAACNHCGPCLLGCVRHAKASVDATYWPKALRNGVELRPRSVTTEIVVQGGRATGVRFHDADGAEHELPATWVVVAGNGIGSARLLLASGIGGDVVGRNLMFHPVAGAMGVFDAELDGPAGPAATSIYSHEFYETDPSRDFVRGVQLQVAREVSPLSQALGAPLRWGRDAQQLRRRLFRHSAFVGVLIEDLPEPENRVVLADRVEADRLPGVRIEYRLSADSQRRIDFGAARAAEVLQAAGAALVFPLPQIPEAGWHLLGTARMGSDPRTSVTDARGRCHDVPNVIVADGSLFPTCGAVNPGSTIGALALKVADDLAREVIG